MSPCAFVQQTVTIEKELEAIHNGCYAVLGKTHTALSGGSHQGRLLSSRRDREL